MNPGADFCFSKGIWQNEIKQLRSVVLDCGLNEELKWGSPCYTFQNRNIVLIHVFKEYCALLFFKGALLKDVKGILVQQSPNVQSARQIRFTNVQEIIKKKTVLKTYIFEAVEVEKAGLKVAFKKSSAYEVPGEFGHTLKKVPGLKKAFDALTPGRQRGYLLFFAQPKQSVTREARVQKCIPLILEGKGLKD